MIAANAPIEELDFTVGTYNALKRWDIHTVADLASCTEEGLYRVLGNSYHKRLDEINVVLGRHGRSLAIPPPSKPSVAPQIP